MIDPQALGALAGTQQLLLQLVETLPARDCNRRFDDELPSAGWLLGRAVYLELRLLRGLVLDDHDLAGRVEHLFADDSHRAAPVDGQLPPADHLRAWAHEIFDQDLTTLANPGQLPQHALLDESWLPWHIAQRLALVYERLLAVMTLRSALRDRGEYRVSRALHAQLPADQSTRIEQGHYRVGARQGPVMANELPPQTVELNAFRICRRPVRNTEFLAFIEDGGYTDMSWWDDAGRRWIRTSRVAAPRFWRQDADASWYGIGTNGPVDLQPDDVLSGISAHEARAFAAWASSRGEGLSGAVPQHEYQWEVAARLGAIELVGRAWEWCANGFHYYPGYQPPSNPILDPWVDTEGIALRGGCLHTQPCLRRTTARLCADPRQRTLFAGTRLILPPGKAAWE